MPEVLTKEQEALLNDKLARAAEREAKSQRRAPRLPTIVSEDEGPAAPIADAVYTAAVPVATLATGASEVAFLVEPRGLATYSGLSADTLKSEITFAEASDAWKAEREKLNGMRQIADAETVTLAEIRERRDGATELELALAQRAVGLNRRYVELQQARLPELRSFVTEHAAKLVDVEADVTKKLNDAGVSIQSQMGWPHNHHAAEIQFSHVVRRSSEWQAQQLQVSEAEAQVQVTADCIAAGKARIVESEKSLLAKVRKLVS